MKSFIFIIVIIALPISSIFSQTKSKPQRLNEDSKILGQITIKDPHKIYKKIVEISSETTPGILQEIEEDIALFLPILEKSTSIVIIYYYKKNDLTSGYFISVNDKKVFDNIFITSLENKEIVENTLIIGENKDFLKIFKDLLPKINALTLKNDVNFCIDLNNIFTSYNQEFELERHPHFKNLTQQFETLSLSLNISKEPFIQELTLIPTDKSNLQKLLTQTGIDKTPLLDIIGIGNIIGSYNQFDFTKSIPFIFDILRAYQNEQGQKELEKADLKEFEKNIQDVVSKAGIIQSASNSSIDKETAYTEIIKCQNPKVFLNELISFFKKESNKSYIEFIKEIVEILQDDFFETDYSLNVDILEKINDADVYKISSKKMGEELDFLDFTYFITANETNIFICDTATNLKVTMDKAKNVTSKAPLMLESFVLFKAGLSSYTDINLLGIFKAVNLFLKGEEYDELNIDDLTKEKLSPIKIGHRMDGNFTCMFQLDLSTLKTIAKAVWPLFMDSDEIEIMDEDSFDQPDTQP